jgi:hypothetical protein
MIVATGLAAVGYEYGLIYGFIFMLFISMLLFSEHG